MTSKKHKEAILAYLEQRTNRPLKPRQLARMMGVAESEYGAFRAAYKQLRDAGRLVIGSASAMTLPNPEVLMEGRFTANPKGFGFIAPDNPDAPGDLFVPRGRTGGAMDGDRVRARVVRGRRRDGQLSASGEVIEILERGTAEVVGTIDHAEDTWFLLPDGKKAQAPVVIRDVPPEARRVGLKAVIEITEFPAQPGDLPAGVIVELLGEAGQPAAEIRAVIRARSIPEQIPKKARQQAARLARGFDPGQLDGREDLTGEIQITIDPVDARDYDDAISLRRNPDGTVTLGVHIADVSHFVTPGSALDQAAHERGTSVYFPGQVLPMLPEVLSNGVCSLQEGVPRYTKSVFIGYDGDGMVTEERLANTVIRSRKRLTYEQAQAICDGDDGGCEPEVVELVREMERLAKRIERRRRANGMLHLDLPEVELIRDDEGKVVDARPADSSYSHTMIEMFMVEANEAVAEVLEEEGLPTIRRIHPDPDEDGFSDLATFVRICGHRLPPQPTAHDLQQLIERVAGAPESHAINLAVLRSLTQASYSAEEEGHFALASDAYCHFTSPIRRYADLVVHRIVDDLLRHGVQRARRDPEELAPLAEHCSLTSRRAEAAEHEVRQVLVLQHLAQHVGESFDGVITGVADFGIFVQSPRFLAEGLIRLEQLGDDWWQVEAKQGRVRGQTSGVLFRIGDRVRARVARVDVARRQLDLALDGEEDGAPVKPRGRRPLAPRSDRGGHRSSRPKKAGRRR